MDILKFRAFASPAKFDFTDPDTDRYFQANTKSELIKQIVNYRAQNRLAPIQFLDKVLENYWCLDPLNIGKCEEVKLARGLFPILKGAVFVIKNIFYGKDNLVGIEEAERRARICARCPANVNPEPGGFDAWSDEVAIASVGDTYLDMDFTLRTKLHNCEVCTCPLKAKVWYKGKLELTEAEVKELPYFCWQHDLVDK